MYPFAGHREADRGGNPHFLSYFCIVNMFSARFAISSEVSVLYASVIVLLYIISLYSCSSCFKTSFLNPIVNLCDVLIILIECTIFVRISMRDIWIVIPSFSKTSSLQSNAIPFLSYFLMLNGASIREAAEAGNEAGAEFCRTDHFGENYF